MIEVIKQGADAMQLGTASGWTLVGIVLLFWWKGLPGLITAWEKRSEGIENRLQAAMTITLDRYELELKHFSDRLTETNEKLAESDKKHRDCEERAQKQSERINHLEKEIIGFQRQIAAQDIARAGHLNLDQAPATKAAVARMKVIT